MDRETAITMAQQAIKAKNRRLVEAVLEAKAVREQNPLPDRPIEELPLVAVTCSTGWECYAVVEELTKTLRFRVRALYRTPGTQAAARLETLYAKTEATHPGVVDAAFGCRHELRGEAHRRFCRLFRRRFVRHGKYQQGGQDHQSWQRP